jgi:hypothetical protein
MESWRRSGELRVLRRADSPVSVAHGRFEIQQNEPRGFAPLPEHGAEDIDAEPKA